MTSIKQHLTQKHTLFVAVGALNTILAFAFFAIFIKLFQSQVNVLFILIISSFLGYVTGYIFYKIFVWKDSGFSFFEFFRFVRSSLLILLINIFSLYIFVTLFEFNAVYVQLFTTCTLVVFSFFIHEKWTFRIDDEMPRTESYRQE